MAKAAKNRLTFSPFALFSYWHASLKCRPARAVALIYAEGVITDGEGSRDCSAEQRRGVRAHGASFRMAARDESIKAIVIRIDSPAAGPGERK